MHLLFGIEPGTRESKPTARHAGHRRQAESVWKALQCGSCGSSAGSEIDLHQVRGHFRPVIRIRCTTEDLQPALINHRSSKRQWLRQIGEVLELHVCIERIDLPAALFAIGTACDVKPCAIAGISAVGQGVRQ